MKLNTARLCLDCDEVHDEPRCPVCASESFAFIKRWVTAPERQAAVPATPNERAERAATYRALLAANQEPTMARRLVKGGVMGLAVLGAAGWLLQRTGKNKAEEPAEAAVPADRNEPLDRP
jgi:hypothetical protein